MGFWRHHFSSKHLDSGDLVDCPKAMIKIVKVGDSDEEDTDGEKKMKITFEPGTALRDSMLAKSTAKPPKAKNTWVCSVTIGHCLAAIFGDDDSKWIGKFIVVYAAKIRDGEAVRVWGSPHLTEEKRVPVRDFGGKRTWVLAPVPMPGKSAPDASGAGQ